MKAFQVSLERGNRIDARTYLVIAPGAATAARKAEKAAIESSRTQTGWRVVSLSEQNITVVL